MSDMQKIKSNFVRGLEENNNRILTYVTIFFTFAFLGCLLAFWVYEYRSNRCVFGPSCCYTDLYNHSKDVNLEEAVLTQVTPRSSWGISSGNIGHERVTFPYLESPSSTTKSTSFTLDIYPGNKISDGISFPFNNPDTNSGFSIVSTGVSVYLDFYTGDSGKRWNYSHNLVFYGVSQFIDTQIREDFYAIVTPNNTKPGGFNYITSSQAPDGAKSNLFIKSELSDKPYFGKGSGTKRGIAIKSRGSDPYQYNPFMDFLHAKKKVKDSQGCSPGAGVSCHCIEPSSKNLPSCKNPYFEGKGYAYRTKTKPQEVKYSRNCSHSYYPGYLVDPSEQSNAAQSLGFIEESAPPESALGKVLSKCPNTDDGNAGSGCGPDGEGETNLSLGNGTGSQFGSGNTAFKQSYKHSYDPSALFCGGGNQTTNSALYTAATGATNPSDDSVATATRGSSFPNAKSGKGNQRILGFN